MKQILRLVIIAAVLVGVGFGVWAIFFQKDNDEVMYNTLTTMMDTLEDENMGETPLEQIRNYDVYDYCFDHAYASCDAIIEDIQYLYNTGISMDYQYDSELGCLANVNDAQMLNIRYFYSLSQFVDNVKGKDVKKIKSYCKNVQSAIASVSSMADDIVIYQETFVAKTDEERKTLVVELAKMYDDMVAKYKDYLTKQNTLANYMKKVVTTYALNNNYLYDAKGAVLEAFLYQSDAIINNDAEASYDYLTEMYRMILTYENDMLSTKFSTNFVTSYQKLKEAQDGQEQIEKMIAIRADETFGGKADIYTLDSANFDTWDTEVFSHYGIKSDYYLDAYYILQFLYA